MRKRNEKIKHKIKCDKCGVINTIYLTEYKNSYPCFNCGEELLSDVDIAETKKNLKLINSIPTEIKINFKI